MSAQHNFEGAPLVGTASTFYTDKTDPRFELALETAENYRNAGVPYVVVDASNQESSSWVAEAHRARGATVLRATTPGIATQRQQGVAFAIEQGADKVLGQEPEKTLLPTFTKEISAKLTDYDILVIGRTAQAEASLPPVQRYTERLAGWILEQTHDMPADALSGGRGFTVSGASILAEYPATIPGMNNWIYLYDTVLKAREQDLHVGSLTLDLIHPFSMVAQETGSPIFDRKRYNQFKLQLDYLLTLPEVKLQARPLANSIVAILATVKPDMPNDTVAARIAEIETLALRDGYQPTAH